MQKLLFTLLVCTVAVWAQFDSAAVLGSVRDSTGLPIQRAKVLLQNVATGVQLETMSDEAGSYQFLTVKAGQYTVSAEAQGFKKAQAGPFTVTVNARQRVDLALEVGAVTESVTVTGAVQALETETSSRGTVVSTEQVVNLPLNGRNYADLALLAPGVRRSGIAVNNDGSTNRESSFNVNGMRSSQNNFLVDGVDNNYYGTSNQGFTNQVVQLTPDAVQEFRLETNNFSAEYGRAGGAVINASVRSGTNQFHGSAWEFLRNTSLNATGFFKPVNNQKPVFIRNQFGAAGGGPIKKEKLFFFADYEGSRQISKNIRFTTLPTMEMRQGRLPVAVRNPITGQVFNDGVIPGAQITRFASAVLADLPAPNRPGIANNFEHQPRWTDNFNKGDIRVDNYISQKWTLFGRYSHRVLERFEAPDIPGPSGGNSNGNVRVLNQQWVAGTTYTLSPTSLVEFRIGVSRSEGGKTPIFVGTPTIGDRFGIPNIPNDPRYTGGIMQQSINGFSQLGVQGSNPQFQNPFVWNPKVNFSKVMGRHSMKVGYEYQAIITDIDDFNPKYGASSYAGRFSQVPGTGNNDAQFLADFLFGARSQYQANNALIVSLKQRMHFLYLQDDFKATRKLTLNLGLRYEYGSPQWEDQNRLSNYDQVANTRIDAKDGSTFDRALVRPDKNNFAPRIGLAYTVTPRTVIRSAYGISFIHFNRLGGENLLSYNLPHILNPIVDQLAPAVNNGLPLCTSSAQAAGTCFLTTEQGYPNNLMSLANIRQINVRTNHIPFDLRTAYTQSWHLTIQRELAKNLVFDVAYVGNRSVGLMILGDLNQARPNNVGQNLSLQARRPIQEFGYIQSAFNGGFLNYHALQTKLERRFSRGFYIMNSFTWSKAIDNASGHLESQNGDNSRVNYRNIAGERGPSGYDQRLNNTTTLIWDVPVGRGRRWGSSMKRAADLLVGGWRMTTINFMNSGVPVNLTYSPSSQFQVSGAPSYRPNLVGNPLVPEDQRSPARWLDAAAVVLPTDPSQPFGNAGRNAIYGPSFYQMNFGLHKDFAISESKRIEFRSEAFNLLNKTNFNNPNGNRSSGAFGTITSTQQARQIQFALRFVF